MKNSGSPTLILQSCRVSNEPLWFLVAIFLNFIAVENSIMPFGICEHLSIDFSIQHKWFSMREHLKLWNYMCSRKYCLKKRCELETGEFWPKIYQGFFWTMKQRAVYVCYYFLIPVGSDMQTMKCVRLDLHKSEGCQRLPFRCLFALKSKWMTSL